MSLPRRYWPRYSGAKYPAGAVGVYGAVGSWCPGDGGSVTAAADGGASWA